MKLNIPQIISKTFYIDFEKKMSVILREIKSVEKELQNKCLKGTATDDDFFKLHLLANATSAKIKNIALESWQQEVVLDAFSNNKKGKIPNKIPTNILKVINNIIKNTKGYISKQILIYRRLNEGNKK